MRRILTAVPALWQSGCFEKKKRNVRKMPMDFPGAAAEVRALTMTFESRLPGNPSTFWASARKLLFSLIDI